MRKSPNKDESPVTLLIGDDYPFFRHGLRTFLEEQPNLTVVGEAGSGEELRQLCRDLKPDIVLTALELAASDGVLRLDALRELSPQTRFIVLAGPEDVKALAGCVEGGIAGCVMKNADPSVLLSAMRTVIAGGYWLQRELTGDLFDELRLARDTQRRRADALLSDRETEVLKLLAEGLRNSQIAQRLFISERTVKVHVAKIFSKLRLHDRVQATRYAIKAGLVRP